jgi:MAF protein
MPPQPIKAILIGRAAACDLLCAIALSYALVTVDGCTLHTATRAGIHQVLPNQCMFAYHALMQTPLLILASGSQRRQEFFRQLGLAYSTIVADIDETPLESERPGAMTCRLAEEKARAVAARLQPKQDEVLIIASDTTVALGDLIYGKPVDAVDAKRMLLDLRDRSHQVISAVSVLHLPSAQQSTRINTTTVMMRNYNDEEIDAYVASGDPLDKAGAYGIQARDFAPVLRLDGCYAGVMGLPLADVADLLAEFGIAVTKSIPRVCGLYNTFACCAANPAHSAAIAFTP